MKLEKLDRKQLPQVVVLAVLTVGVLVFGLSQFMGMRGSPPAEGEPVPPRAEVTTPPPGQAQTDPRIERGSFPLTVADAGPVLREDPFRAPPQPRPPAPPATSAPPSRPAPPPPFGPLVPEVVIRPQPTGPPPGQGVEPPGQTLPPPPPDPATFRPTEMLVTGVIEGEHNLAILRFSATDRRIVRVGDEVPGREPAIYRVAAIGASGVLLQAEGDEWLVEVGPRTSPSVINGF